MPSRTIKYLFIGLISLTIGTYVRLHPLLSYSSDDSSEKATIIVLTKLREVANLQTEKQNPFLEKTQRDILAKNLFNELIKKEKNNINITINKLKMELEKNRPQKSQTPYLLEADPFYYYGLTENILTTGHLGSKVQGGKFLNDLMLAPLGHWVPLTLHPYIGIFIYKTIQFFYPSISLMHAVSFTPLLISGLSLIPFLLLLFLLNIRPTVAFTGSIFYLLSPIFLKRSLYGWYDNDPYNLFFPLTILCLFFYAFQHLKENKKMITFIILMSLAITLYAHFWQGWMFLFCILSASIIGAFILQRIFLKKFLLTFKETGLSLVIFLTTSFLTISIAFGVKDFFILFAEGWAALKNFLTPQLSVWPDIFISVGELHEASLGTIIELTGGFLFFSFILLGVFKNILDIFLTIKTKSEPNVQNFFMPLTMVLLFLTLLVLSLGAQRFILLCLIPFSILFPVGLDKTLCFFENILLQFKNKKIHYIFFALSLSVLLLSLIPFSSIRSQINTLVTNIYNDAWDNTMREIKTKTPSESIIATWWPPGHFITSMAKRRVIFDGGTINVPQGYWLANFFLSQDETEALGILRMLHNSGNQAAEYLETLGFPVSLSVTILKTILPLNRQQAYQKLKTIIPDDIKINHLLSLTHKKPPASYCLLYNEFVERNIQLSFLGNWNFKAIETINKDPQEFKKVPNRHSREYIDFLWQLSGGVKKYSGALPQISKENHTIIFAENIKINLQDMTCTISSNQYGKGIPYSLFYLNSNGEMIEKRFNQWTLGYSVVLFEDGKQYAVILMDHALAKSLFIQLYFFDGKGLRYFKPFTHQSDLTKRTEIKVFEVDWEGFYQEIGEHNP